MFALLPISLAALLPRANFTAWALAISLTSYVVVFQAGVQQAVIAAAGRARDSEPQEEVALPLAAALQFLAPLLLTASILALAIAVFARYLFPAIPHELLWEFQICFLSVYVASLASSVSTIIWGHAIGTGAFGTVLIAVIAGAAISFVATIAVAAATSNIAAMGLAFAVPNVLSVPLQASAAQLKLKHFALRFRDRRRRYRRGYREAAKTLVFWSLGGLMVTGLDGSVVGRLDFQHAGVYMLIATVVTVLISGLGSWQSSFLAQAHRQYGSSGFSVVGRVARIAMVIYIVSACVAAFPVWLLAGHLFSGGDLRLAYTIYIVLISANILRLFTAPVILTSLAARRYDRLILPALLEGLVNLAMSVVLCATVGAIGVAFGTLIGAVVSFVVLIGYTLQGAAWTELDLARFVREGLTRPATFLVGPVALSVLAPLMIIEPAPAVVTQIAAAVLSVWVAWRLCMMEEDRNFVRGIARRLRLSAVLRSRPQG